MIIIYSYASSFYNDPADSSFTNNLYKKTLNQIKLILLKYKIIWKVDDTNTILYFAIK